jgi:hypothetical protein
MILSENRFPLFRIMLYRLPLSGMVDRSPVICRGEFLTRGLRRADLFRRSGRRGAMPVKRENGREIPGHYNGIGLTAGGLNSGW